MWLMSINIFFVVSRAYQSIHSLNQNYLMNYRNKGGKRFGANVRIDLIFGIDSLMNLFGNFHLLDLYVRNKSI